MCGIFGVVGHPDPLRLTYEALRLLQHRGQEASGIAFGRTGEKLRCFKSGGPVRTLANTVRNYRRGDLNVLGAVGHVRYSTVGDRTDSKRAIASQPFLSDWSADVTQESETVLHQSSRTFGCVAVSHNGNLEPDCLGQYSRHPAESDSDLLARSYSYFTGDLGSRTDRVYSELVGAFSYLAFDGTRLIGVRDPYGFHPLCFARLPDGGIAFSSESFVLSLFGATEIEHVLPGSRFSTAGEHVEFVILDNPIPPRCCIFEYVYFARPDSDIDGLSVYATRRMAGRLLAIEHPVEADVVVGVPDSGLVAALGFSSISGIPNELGLVRSHYVDRTFIEPDQRVRSKELSLKFSAVESVIRGRRVVVVDDSVVRGNTAGRLCEVLRQFGAKEIHLRVASPPSISPCRYGIDVRTTKELVASELDFSRPPFDKFSSVGYLSLGGLTQAVRGKSTRSFCDACFSGNYPIPMDDNKG